MPLLTGGIYPFCFTGGAIIVTFALLINVMIW